ncbi:MAG TPA: tRNA uridine-5-carboxymethylaminomethyl(34) synthesis GTPase MnmE [Candidatus Methylomirabilis sp.]|nr:tRNA uridine-5-carboxymethylaminomethyl(34) synthesis GTPase MnmE [Candidatus Methylomirabilis sp.]
MSGSRPRDPFQDTIAAIATPPGEGGIGIVRLSGAEALEIAARAFRPSSGADPRQFASHSIHHGTVGDPDTGGVVDEVLLMLMRAPRSYTGEDVVELHGHGGRVAVQALLALIFRHGARPALPGEFTRRAFLNGRLDLAQAEAVLDIVQAKTEAGLKAAVRQLRGGLSDRVRELRAELIALLATLEASVDFPEDGHAFPEVGELEKRMYGAEERIRALMQKARDGRLLREGATVVIAGRPNVGKSSLLNALLGRERAIVSPVPGTTRDTVEEAFEIGGVHVRLIDTAGLREGAEGPVEQEGLRRTRAALAAADLTIVVMDGSEGIAPLDREVWSETRDPRVLVVNKADLPPALPPQAYRGRLGTVPLFTSALSGQGVEEVRGEIGQRLAADLEGEATLMVRPRHHEGLQRAEKELRVAREGLGQGLSPDLIALDLRAALDALSEIVGESVTEEVLDRIFQDFCIGK